MIGWLIILAIFVIIGLVMILGNILDWWDLDDNIIVFMTNIISWCAAIVILLVIIFMPLEVKQEINKFEQYQELVEASYSEEETELNFAMNIQVIELNTWLAEAKSYEETYGIFSFYHGKIDDLQYIEIGD